MSEIIDVSRMINYSSGYKIRYFSVSDPLFSQFEQSFRSFFKALGAAVETRLYAKIAHYLKKIRYQMSISLLPYNQIVSPELLSSIEDMVKQGKLLNPESEQIFDGLVQALHSFSNHTSSALLECLKQNILRFSSHSYCIVTKRDMYTTEKDYILTVFRGFNITFINERRFREEKQVFDYVIFMGNEGYFHHSFNNIPRSRSTAFISRDTYRNDFSDNSLFIDWPFPRFSTMYQNLDTEKITFFHNIPEAEESQSVNVVENGPLEQEIQIEEPDFSLPFIRLMAEITGPLPSEDGYDFEKEMVPAKAFELQGEKLIFIRISKGRHDVITEDGIFKRKRVDEIVPGDSLVLSSVSDDRLVERMADAMYEQQNIQLYRTRQAKLKDYLSRMTEKNGIYGFCRLLKRKGLSTITQAKIKNLLKPSSFKLQNKKEYFQFLLTITKNNEQIALKYYEAGRRLAVFHISAGKKARQILRNTLENADLTELLAKGTQVIELKEVEGLCLEIRKVEGVGSDLVQILPSQDKKVMDY